MIQEGVGLAHRFVQGLLGLLVWLKWLALLDADRPERVDHDAVAVEPRFALHKAVERLKKA